jgi:hypothetical protein
MRKKKRKTFLMSKSKEQRVEESENIINLKPTL